MSSEISPGVTESVTGESLYRLDRLGRDIKLLNEVREDLSQESSQDMSALDPGKALLCAACKTVVTWQGQAIEPLGRHIHTFTNPEGLEYTIAGFALADCLVVGEAIQAWSWFHNYTWQVAICRGCQRHLGWFYQNRACNDAFYGLILSNLIVDGS